eukprot:SAG25_NODE_3846_length_952_cov_1.025791_1_plen_73_part_00
MVCAHAQAEYDAEMGELESILAARRAMGAAMRTEMPIQPWKPAYRILPTDEEMATLIKGGQAASKKKGRRRR